MQPDGVPTKPRLLIFIVAYNAERTIENVLSRIPHTLKEFHTEILVIDDASRDRTYELSESVCRAGSLPFPLHVLVNPVNQGYGGNQKLGFEYAIRNHFDVVALLHGDGQYAPEVLPELLGPIVSGQADAVFGSRMMKRFAALRGGMPLYKYLGNKVLTTFQNVALGTTLSEFHSGYRVYSTRALAGIPFELNTSRFHFDTEIIIQLIFSGARIVEKPIPTYYGDEICHVDGLRYALDVVRSTAAAKLQSVNLVYRRNFDVRRDSLDNAYYSSKLGFESPHSVALELVEPGQVVVDLGCAGAYLASPLRRAGCRVIGVDRFEPGDRNDLDVFIKHDLDMAGLPLKLDRVDTVLLLDVIEHLRSPEAFVRGLREACDGNPSIRVVVSTGNIAFIVPRLMLALGQFNYGKRGILDITHTRLFTFGSLRRLFEEGGFEVLSVRGLPAPVPLVLRGRFAKALLRLNQWLIRVSGSVFAYQIMMVLRPLPTVPRLLEDAHSYTWARSSGRLPGRAYASVGVVGSYSR